MKVEQLLLELLPRSVADKLKAGHQIPPETFDDVTIFFSDIVSFTRISAAGTPIDVIKMLNLMYTMFDDIAVKYDVYKVATIGTLILWQAGCRFEMARITLRKSAVWRCILIDP